MLLEPKCSGPFGVDAGCANGGWELEECARKKFSRVRIGWVYKGSDPGSENGHPGFRRGCLRAGRPHC